MLEAVDNEIFAFVEKACAAGRNMFSPGRECAKKPAVGTGTVITGTGAGRLPSLKKKALILFESGHNMYISLAPRFNPLFSIPKSFQNRRIRIIALPERLLVLILHRKS